MSLFSSRLVSMEKGKRALGVLLRTWIGEPSRERVVTVGVLIVLFVGVLDVLTGDELSFSIFYVFPISLVVLLSDRRSGLVLSIADELMYSAKQEGKGRVKCRMWSESGEYGSPKKARPQSDDDQEVS